jgi:F0F1-type ATP synthase delta subunit
MRHNTEDSGYKLYDLLKNDIKTNESVSPQKVNPNALGSSKQFVKKIEPISAASNNIRTVVKRSFTMNEMLNHIASEEVSQTLINVLESDGDGVINQVVHDSSQHSPSGTIIPKVIHIFSQQNDPNKQTKPGEGKSCEQSNQESGTNTKRNLKTIHHRQTRESSQNHKINLLLNQAAGTEDQKRGNIHARNGQNAGQEETRAAATIENDNRVCS